jgi:prepilin signal peptidase PulO-like enzyme (type II secretory pathway)
LNPLTGSAGAILYAVLGLVAGSFATAASHRLTTDQPLAVDRSRCPKCGHVLGPLDLVPVLSWAASAGKCRYCRAPISSRYPLIEVTTVALFVGSWWLGGPDPFRAALLALTALGLMIITVADLEARIIPDKVLLAMIPLALAWRWHLDPDWIDAVAGAAIGGAIMYGVRAIFKSLRGVDAMGLGDVKFIILAGVYVGLLGLAPLLIVAGLAGIVFGLIWRGMGFGAAFPFGPALCWAMAAVIAAPEWFSRLFLP